jgi:uncharacterized OB-fold protein
MTPMQRMSGYAAVDKLALQRCIVCGATQYPPRELCAACLADELTWVVADFADGEVLAHTTLHHSHEAAFRSTLPLHVGLVRLDLGPTVVCFLGEGCEAGMRIQITAHLDAAGRAVLAAKCHVE